MTFPRRPGVFAPARVVSSLALTCALGLAGALPAARAQSPSSQARPTPVRVKRQGKAPAFSASDWFRLRRADSKGLLNPAQFAAAAQQRDRMTPASAARAPHAAVQSAARTAIKAIAVPVTPQNWTFVGPKGLRSNGFETDLGPLGTPFTGQANRVVFDNRLVGVAYLTSPSGGVWKSVNGGQTWAPIGDQQYTLKATALTASNNTVWVGMGDADSPYGGYYSRGLLRSTDGGATFTSVGSPDMAGVSIGEITVDPDDPRIVTVTAGEYGWSISSHNFVEYGSTMFRTVDNGVNWRKVQNITNDPNGTSAIGVWRGITVSQPNVRGQRSYWAAGTFVGAGFPFGPYDYAQPVLYRSTNRGFSFAPVPLPDDLPFFLSFFGDQFTSNVRCDVIASPTNADVVYFAATNRTGGAVIYKGTLTPISEFNSSPIRWDFVASDVGTPTGLDLRAVAYADVDPDGLPIQRDRLYLASDGAQIFWPDLGSADYLNNPFNLPLLPSGARGIAVNPFSTSSVLLANKGGGYLLDVQTTTDGALTSVTPFEDSTSSLALTEFWSGAFHPTDPTRMLGGANVGAPVANGNPGAWINAGIQNGGGVAINPTTPQTQYVAGEAYLSLFRTLDEWQTPAFDVDGKAIAPGEDISPLAIGPEAIADRYNQESWPAFGPLTITPNGTLYIASEYLWRYTEAGGWEADLGRKTVENPNGQKLAGLLFNNGQVVQQPINAIAVAPSDPNRIYTGSNDGQIWRSSNGGTSFTRLPWDGDQGIQPFSGYVLHVTCIDVNPTNPNDILVTVAGTYTATAGQQYGIGYVYRSTNAGTDRPVFTLIQGNALDTLPYISANSITRDPRRPDLRFFVGTDIGVFLTENGGQTWTNATTPLGLPNVQVNTIKAVEGTGLLNVATFGRGMWQLPLGELVTVPDPQQEGLPYVVGLVSSIRAANIVSFRYSFTNRLTTTLPDVRLSAAQVIVGSKATGGTPIPQVLGTVPAKGMLARNITFPGTVGAKGTAATLRLTFRVGNGPATTIDLPVVLP